MESECSGSEDTFDEYYPEDEVSCFLSSGRPRFNVAALRRLELASQLHAPEAVSYTHQDVYKRQEGAFVETSVHKPLVGLGCGGEEQQGEKEGLHKESVGGKMRGASGEWD